MPPPGIHQLHRAACALVLAYTLLHTSQARAFTFESVASVGCHERITQEALRRSPWPAEAAPLHATREDRLLGETLPFHPPADADGWLLALLIGARDNDLLGYTLVDLPELAEVHLGPERQDEHCLRSPWQDFAGGDVEALADCRRYILQELTLALGTGAEPDYRATEPVRLALRDRHTTLELPRYPYHVGRALHALQDSFTHMVRTDDHRQVRSVLNYVDPAVDHAYAPERDGFGHLSVLDGCEGDPVQVARAEAATAASAELLAALSESGGNGERMARMAALLERHLAYAPACQGAAWCPQAQVLLDASLPLSVRQGGGCSSAGASGGAVALLALAGLLLRRGQGRRAGCAAAVGVAALLVGAPARAQEVGAARWRPVGVALTLGGSMARAGLAAAVGGRWRPSERFSLAADLEFNPWMDLVSAKASPGVLNGYLTGFLHWMGSGPIELRSSAGLGASMLLMDTVGAEVGSVGPFLSLGLLSASVRLGERAQLELRPDLVVAVPSLRGVPFAYQQYRFSVTYVLEL